MIIKPFTKPQRLKIYKKALSFYKQTPSKCEEHIKLLYEFDNETQWLGMCLACMKAIKVYHGIEYPQISTDNLHMYLIDFGSKAPEYVGEYKINPNRPCSIFWFERDIYGRAKRIDILKELIKENQPIKLIK